MKHAGTVSLAPSWHAAAAIIAEGLENGTPRGRQLAREELAYMARLIEALRPLAELAREARPFCTFDLAGRIDAQLAELRRAKESGL